MPQKIDFLKPILKACLPLIFYVISSLSAQAQDPFFTIAVLDTGIDFDHPCLKEVQWENPNESFNQNDDDNNGYPDDKNGWNFILESNQIFDRNWYPFFNNQFFQYYNIRSKKTLGTASPQELSWYKEKLKDRTFQEKRRIFTRMIHGTHIAGLASGCPQTGRTQYDQNFSRPTILNVTYLGKAKKGLAKEPVYIPLRKGDYHQRFEHIHSFVNIYVNWQVQKLKRAIDYATPFSKVINGSFGSSLKTGRKKIKSWYQIEFELSSTSKTDTSNYDHYREFSAFQEKWSRELLNKLIKKTSQLLTKYPQHLFVFSAGNAKEDNDQSPHYPSNVRLPHVISVGASFGRGQKAYFSNYGKTTVDLFAPGASITSSTPDQSYLPTNGTSQAAPQVSFVAINLIKKSRELNLRLKTQQIKELLIKSADLKAGFESYSASGGIINHQRAIKALELYQYYPLKLALKKAREQIKDLNDPLRSYHQPKKQINQNISPLKPIKNINFLIDDLISPL